VLIEGVNDSDADIDGLLSFDWPANTNFNLIEFNPIDNLIPSDRLEAFKEAIMKKGYKCFIRASRGKDISAACGMLDVAS
jgi:adenine C2-methylase RlmN of 23S rRNA A2503 and tRNA A37